MNVFDSLINFSEKECRPSIGGQKVENPYRVNGLLMVTLDQLRDDLTNTFKANTPLVITRGWDDGAGDNSQHHTGAVDFYLKTQAHPRAQLAAIQDYLALSSVRFRENSISLSQLSGFGYYLDWNSAEIGFHLDLRGYKARWCRVEGEYLTFQEGLKHL